MRVFCINDKNLPEGAEVVSGKEYVVLSSRMNSYGQKILFLEGIRNNFTTSKGFQWNGYDAKRFAELDTDGVEISEEEVAFEPALN